MNAHPLQGPSLPRLAAQTAPAERERHTPSSPAGERHTLSPGPTALPTTSESATPTQEPEGVDARDGYVPGELLVKTRQRLDASASAMLAGLGVTQARRFAPPAAMRAAMGGEMYRLRLSDKTTVEQALQRLRGSDAVVWAEPNYRVHTLDRVPDDLEPRHWGLRNDTRPGADIHATEAWGVTTGKTVAEGGPLIAVIDTGIDASHPDLAPNIWTHPGEIAGDGIDNDGNGFVDDARGYDFAYHDADPSDGTGHGTHVAGTIAAVGDNGQGSVGVAWKASVLPLKFLDDGGFGDMAGAVEALIYAEKTGARITSNSWGSAHYSQALRDTLQASHALHVCAAGNDGADSDSTPVYPAGYDLDNIIAVAATDRTDQRAPFSNHGQVSVDIAAPGAEIWSTLPGGGCGLKSGTSMAAPHVTGAAALVLSQFPELTNAQLKERLIDAVDHVPALADVSLSGGRLNVARALIDDRVAPAPVTDLRVEAAGPDAVNIAFTATGDDGASGTAARYEVRWSDRPIVDGVAGPGEISWADANTARPPVPQAAGSAETISVGLLPDAVAQPFHVALKVRDKAGNASAVATASTIVPAGRVAFRDDFDHGLDQWNVEGGWAVVNENGSRVVTDSPQGDYPSNSDSRLTSRVIDLRDITHPVLEYRARHTVDDTFDHLTVEASDDGGQTWRMLEPLKGRTPWVTHSCDLSAYAGRGVQIRWRLVADADIESDGIHIDRVVVTERA